MRDWRNKTVWRWKQRRRTPNGKTKGLPQWLLRQIVVHRVLPEAENRLPPCPRPRQAPWQPWQILPSMCLKKLDPSTDTSTTTIRSPSIAHASSATSNCPPPSILPPALRSIHFESYWSNCRTAKQGSGGFGVTPSSRRSVSPHWHSPCFLSTGS